MTTAVAERIEQVDQVERVAPPRIPIRAAWNTLVRRPAIWVLIAYWLAQAVGFGVVLQAVLHRDMAAEAPPGTDLAAMRAGLLPGNLAAFGAGSMPFYGTAIALCIGVIAIGSEYRNGTVRLLYSQGPARLGVLGAQAVALSGILGVMTVLTYIADYVGLVVVAGLWDWEMTLPALGPTLVSLLASWLTVTAYGLVGLTLAVATRGITGALTAGLVWCLAVETALIQIGQTVSWLRVPVQGLLGTASADLAVARGSTPWWPGAVSPTAAGVGWVAAATLLAWCAAALIVSGLLVRRRDI
jgi:hypothetical protein